MFELLNFRISFLLCCIFWKNNLIYWLVIGINTANCEFCHYPRIRTND